MMQVHNLRVITNIFSDWTLGNNLSDPIQLEAFLHYIHSYAFILYDADHIFFPLVPGAHISRLCPWFFFHLEKGCPSAGIVETQFPLASRFPNCLVIFCFMQLFLRHADVRISSRNAHSPRPARNSEAQIHYFCVVVVGCFRCALPRLRRCCW